MKLGILTFTAALNHGAQLQAFALRKSLVSLGYEVEMINYAPEYLTRPYSYFYRLNGKRNFVSYVKQSLATFLDTFKWIKGRQKIRAFQEKHYNLSGAPFKHANLFPCKYDCVIVGSDQVWNPEISNGFDPLFFLKDQNVRKISYAASFSLSTLKGDELIELSKLISDFNHISVREENLCVALQQFAEEEINWNVDPTFLLSKKEWEKYIPGRLVKEKYIVVFQARGNKNVCDSSIKRLKKELGVDRVINLSHTNYSLINNQKTDISPLEFVSYIKYAECVVALSFHGVALSLLMERPFYYIHLGDGRDGRVESILTLFDLKDRIINQDSTFKYMPINYRNVTPIIENHREKGISYLKKAIES